ncbi:GlxA family transcriptional regulator [Actinocrispum wychmicini]|uniref:Transcriptional regulator GlxA family with amidase domain n=1 Tax=Actinocrispum wychmicini TaxID=1213861 RepID=A0A4R2J5H3_9PSEU|nr:helix-turn-helix domain-containing protein [Actinocrispum wychmicini]TCO54103.1 transcriptional regulator GlxA family with amidase domain [Actinocrispum wychmicini]
MRVHRVVVLVLTAVQPLELGLPSQLFDPRTGLPYQVDLCAWRPGLVATTAGFEVKVRHGLDALDTADTVVVPGFAPHDRALPRDVTDALAHAHDRGTRMLSICTGAFALAAAGVLDGRRATTHWRYADDLAAAYPAVQVDRDVLYVDEKDVLTSAGIASGIDLCLHVVRRDHGVGAANQLARIVVAAPHRDGGQAQYIERPVLPGRGTRFADTLTWARGNLHERLTVGQLARHAGMSERTLARRFTAELGTTPLRWLIAARIDLACQILENTDCGVEELAHCTGLGTADNLRTHFRRLVGTTPATYRRTFGNPG